MNTHAKKYLQATFEGLFRSGVISGNALKALEAAMADYVAPSQEVYICEVVDLCDFIAVKSRAVFSGRHDAGQWGHNVAEDWQDKSDKEGANLRGRYSYSCVSAPFNPEIPA